jgi:hypothetical protein
MTRISSFGLYECPRCSQIHIKPEYGSISVYLPIDTSFTLDEVKVCKGCRYENKFKEYKYLGLQKKVNSIKPNRLELILRGLLNRPYIELDVRKIYPLFD